MRGAIVVATVAAAAGMARADGEAGQQRAPTPYDRGRISLSVSLGSQRSFDDTYFVVGGRFGYYVLPGLEVALGGMKLFGGSPTIAMVSPEVRYVLYPVDWSVRPFVGGFYHHWFIGSPYDDYDTLGGTLGAMWAQGSGFALGLGVTVEHVVSACDSTMDDCTLVYPSVFLGLSL